MLYVKIFSIARQQMKRIADMALSGGGQSQESPLKQQIKLVKAGLTVFAAFYIFFLSFYIILSVQMYGGIFNFT